MAIQGKKEILKNTGNEIEIKPSSLTIGVTSKTINPGADNEKKVFSISGRVRRNRPTLIGSLTLTAAENKRFMKAPGLKPKDINKTLGLNSQLKMNLVKTESDANNNVTGYVYNLIYTAKEKTGISNKLRYDFTDQTKGIVTKATGIERIVCGDSKLNKNGETRNITIYGDPNETFKIAINKFTDAKDSDDTILNSFEDTILPRKLQNSTHDDIKVLEGTIDSTGRYYFSQRFPSATSETRYSLSLLPTNIKSNFKKNYFTENRAGWEGWYTKTFIQYVNPTLILRVTKTSSDYGINGGGTGTHTYDYSYIGVSGKAPAGSLSVSDSTREFPSSYSNKFIIAYTLVAPTKSLRTKTSGGTTANPHGVPRFNSGVSEKSDWTNSVSEDNGGTSVGVSAVSVSGNESQTYVLKIGFQIIKFGTKSVTMTLDLDTVLEAYTP